jgi:cation diffusion facilitator CzcD-associated flavoprotein CzcO
LAEKAFDKIEIFEQRRNVGGVWNFSSTKWSSKIPIPQTDPSYGSLSQQVSNDHKNGYSYGDEQSDAMGLESESPLYEYLETNIPKQLMAFSDQPFDNDLPLFPGHEAVLEYLERYANDVRHLIQFHTQVERLRLAATHFSDQWEVITKNLENGKPLTSTYDAIIVANGHYTIPYVPGIAGVKAWNNANPGIIIHSKAYRKPEDFMRKKVIVTGNSASGTDIAAQIAQYSKHPLLLSSRTHNELFSGAGSEFQEDVPQIVEFLPPGDGERAVRFQDGRIESNVDAVVFATGYFYNFPFLDLPNPIVTDGVRTRDVYQHLFHIEHPTLAFPVLNLKVVPFPLAENQAAVIARVWSGRLTLPEKEDMRKWELKRFEERGQGKAFHVLKFPEDAVMLNMLFEWAGRATRVEGLENDGVGKLGTWWDETSVWMRERFPEIKKAFTRTGSGSSEVRTLEQLGFDYEMRYAR